MFKRIIAWLFVLLAVLSMAGCAAKEGKEKIVWNVNPLGSVTCGEPAVPKGLTETEADSEDVIKFLQHYNIPEQIGDNYLVHSQHRVWVDSDGNIQDAPDLYFIYPEFRLRVYPKNSWTKEDIYKIRPQAMGWDDDSMRYFKASDIEGEPVILCEHPKNNQTKLEAYFFDGDMFLSLYSNGLSRDEMVEVVREYLSLIQVAYSSESNIQQETDYKYEEKLFLKEHIIQEREKIVLSDLPNEIIETSSWKTYEGEPYVVDIGQGYMAVLNAKEIWLYNYDFSDKQLIYNADNNELYWVRAFDDVVVWYEIGGEEDILYRYYTPTMEISSVKDTMVGSQPLEIYKDGQFLGYSSTDFVSRGGFGGNTEIGVVVHSTSDNSFYFVKGTKYISSSDGIWEYLQVLKETDQTLPETIKIY